MKMNVELDGDNEELRPHDEGVTEPPTWRPRAAQPDPWQSPPTGAVPQPPSGPYPGYPAPSPAAPPPGTPPRTSRRSWVIALVIGVPLLLCGVCLGLFAGIGGFAYLGYRIDKADAVAALTDYLDDVKARNYPDAYDQLCDKAKAGVTREEYARRFRPPLPVSFRIGDVSMADQGADTGYDIAVEVSLDDGQTRTESYFVFSRSSNVDRYYVCPPGS